MISRAKNSRVCSEYDFRNILGIKSSEKIRNRFYLANKVVSLSRLDGNRRMFISKYKELVYKIENGVYLTLSDISCLNDIFIKSGLNEEFDLSQYEMFVNSGNVVTFAGELDLRDEQEDFMYLTAINSMKEFGFNLDPRDYDNYIKYLLKVNRYYRSYVNRNLKDPTLNRQHIRNNFIISGIYEFSDILTDLNCDKDTDTPLSLKYSDRIFKI